MTPLEQTAFLAEVSLDVEAELERGVMSIRDLVALEEGSLIRTERAAGENIGVHVGGSLIGYGEIVVLENIIGVRITHFRGNAIQPAEPGE
jgi:flagellar motor switch protein FliN/FliY